MRCDTTSKLYRFILFIEVIAMLALGFPGVAGAAPTGAVFYRPMYDHFVVCGIDAESRLYVVIVDYGELVKLIEQNEILALYYVDMEELYEAAWYTENGEIVVYVP